MAEERPGPPRTLEFVADSDAQIVRGLIAVLLAAFSGKTPAEILAFPIDKLFAELKLPALVPMRSNGLTSMVRRIQAIAKVAADSEPPAKPAAQPLPLVPLKPARADEPGQRQRPSAGRAKPLLARDDRHRPAVGGVAARCRSDPPRLSDPGDDARRRLSARLSRQRRLDAAAAASDRRDGRGLRALLQQRPPRRPPPGGREQRPLRSGPRIGPPAHQCPQPDRDHLHARHDRRRSTSSRAAGAMRT